MRASGILLPISSIPSPHGIGCFDRNAYRFVDTLVSCGQKYWQILPMGPTGYGDSPYQSFSTFAGNPYYISLDALAEEGLLTAEEIAAADLEDEGNYVNYENSTISVFRFCAKLLTAVTSQKMKNFRHLFRNSRNGCRITACLWQSRTPAKGPVF